MTTWLGLRTQSVTVKRAVGDWTDRGAWQTASWTTFTVTGSLQPVSGEYAQEFPEGVREGIRYVLFLPETEQVLHVARDGARPADRILLQTEDGDTQEMVVLDRVSWRAQIPVALAHVRYAIGEVV